MTPTVTPRQYLQQTDVDNYLAHAYFAPHDRLVELLALYHPHVTTAHIAEWKHEYRHRAPADARKGMGVQFDELAFIEAAATGDFPTQEQRRRVVDAIATATLRPYHCMSQIRASITAAMNQTGRAWTVDDDVALMVYGEEVRAPKVNRQRQQYLDRVLRAHGTPVPAQDPLQGAKDAARYVIGVSDPATHLQDDVPVTQDADEPPAPAPYMTLTPFDGATLTLDADRMHMVFGEHRWTQQEVVQFMSALDYMVRAMVVEEAHPEW